MEFSRVLGDWFKVVNETATRCIKNGGKLSHAVYAGLIMCFVPSVLCQDWSRPLTFQEIFNETNYVQLQQQPRPYLPDLEYSDSPQNSLPLPRHRYNIEYKDKEYRHKYNIEEYEDNEVDIEFDDGVEDFDKEPLLVGFSHDPFRYSVPKEDYLKGVRKMNPNTLISKEQSRGKRGVLHLYNMMYCATGCEPLAYKGYGCYCGFLGSGRPTDGIDRCCKMHDECYENIYCPFFTVYFQPYYWKCYRGEPLCALENYRTEHQFINGCAARLCECDRRFAMCVRKYPCPKRRALCHSSPLRLLQNLLMFR